MPITLNTFAASDTNYVEKFNQNFATIESFVNALEQEIIAAGVEGQALVLDLWDRDGIVGTHSYVLDLAAYSGGASITIGRRPVADPLLGEQDISVAFGTYFGTKKRATLTGDAVLSAAAITTGLPKTVYIGIPTNGTPQFYEDTTQLNVVYAYSMTWDGFQLTNFKRETPILDAYPTLQSIAGAPRMLQVYDSDTDFVGDTVGRTEVNIPGSAEYNEAEFDGAMEVIAVFAHATRSGPDGFYAPTQDPLDPDQTKVRFNIESEGLVWNDSVFEIDAGNVPDFYYKKVNTGVVGDLRFSKVIRRFSLKRTHIGSRVVSARGLLWGVVVRPMLGLPLPRNNSRVVLI